MQLTPGIGDKNIVGPTWAFFGGILLGMVLVIRYDTRLSSLSLWPNRSIISVSLLKSPCYKEA